MQISSSSSRVQVQCLWPSSRGVHFHDSSRCHFPSSFPCNYTIWKSAHRRCKECPLQSCNATAPNLFSMTRCPFPATRLRSPPGDRLELRGFPPYQHWVQVARWALTQVKMPTAREYILDNKRMSYWPRMCCRGGSLAEVQNLPHQSHILISTRWHSQLGNARTSWRHIWEICLIICS